MENVELRMKKREHSVFVRFSILHSEFFILHFAFSNEKMREDVSAEKDLT